MSADPLISCCSLPPDWEVVGVVEKRKGVIRRSRPGGSAFCVRPQTSYIQLIVIKR